MAKDGDATLAEYKAARPPVGTSSKTAREVTATYASLNKKWLQSSALHFELVAVVNRFDRRIFEPRKATCGEVRLIYRAAYRGKRESSRLPVTVVVVFPQSSSDCRAVAKSWLTGTPRPRGVALARFLQEGPLTKVGNGAHSPMSFELNALVELWSRFVHANSPGSHHRYTLRVFRPAGEVLQPEPLENTPDVELVVASPEKKQALLDWVVANKAAIEEGRAFLGALPSVGDVRATQVSSVTAMGLTRAPNRPFSRIFVDDIERFRSAVGSASVGDARVLLRKLDMMTCNGCHVTRSVMGFHLPGEERDGAAYRDPDAHQADAEYQVDADHADGRPIDQNGAARLKAPIAARVTANRLAVGISAHLRDELDRRALDLRRYLHAREHVPMLPPDRGATLRGTHTAPCVVSNAAPALVGSDAHDLACGDGHRCVPLDDSGYGQCVVSLAGSKDARFIGDPFEMQKYSVNTKGLLWATVTSSIDRGPLAGAVTCIGGGETGREMGFPYGGTCEPKHGSLLVDELKKGVDTGCKASDGVIALGESGWLTGSGSIVTKQVQGSSEVVCGLAAFAAGSTWGFMSTAAMVWNSTASGFQLACDVDHPCRDEYVCMRRLPRADRSLRDPAKGTCQPGYLLAQLEIDAHKIPD